MFCPAWVADSSSLCSCGSCCQVTQADDGVLQYPLQGEVHTFGPTWTANRSSLCSLIVVHSSNLVALPPSLWHSWKSRLRLMYPHIGAHLCRFGPRAHVWITATQFRDIDWQHPKVVFRINFFTSNRRKGKTGYRMELRNHNIPMLLVHTVHEYIRPEGILNTKTVAISCLTALGVLCLDLFLGLAFAQWLSARRFLVDMNSLGSRDRFAADRWHCPEESEVN